jgi:hypothetical protein
MLKNKRNAIYVFSLRNIKVANNCIQNMVKFKCFEQQSTNKNFIHEEMKSRLRPRNPVLSPVLNILPSI